MFRFTLTKFPVRLGGLWDKPTLRFTAETLKNGWPAAITIIEVEDDLQAVTRIRRMAKQDLTSNTMTDKMFAECWANIVKYGRLPDAA